jgi:hypothetical protein
VKPVASSSGVVETTTDPTGAQVRVRDVPGQSRFEIVVNDEPAGFAEYHLRPGLITFTHTVVDPAFQGRGLAGVLIKAALDTARRRELNVNPLCPYVAGWLRKHPDYQPLVPEQHRGYLAGPTP